MSHKLAVLGLAILLNMVLISIFAEFVAPYDPTRNHLHKLLAPPDSLNWLGTDRSGRDTFSRVVYGSRVSLSVGVVAVSIYLAIAFAIGATAGLAGGRVDNVLMRFTDLIMTFPSFILIVIMAGILGPSIINVMVIIGIFGWPGLARLIRGQILVQRELDYVIASQALGRQPAACHPAPCAAQRRRSGVGGGHAGGRRGDSGRGRAELSWVSAFRSRRQAGER